MSPLVCARACARECIRCVYSLRIYLEHLHMRINVGLSLHRSISINLSMSVFTARELRHALAVCAREYMYR